MNLLDNFVNIFKLFIAVVSDFTMKENGWGKERKINGDTTLILVIGGEWRLKQNLRQMDGFLTYILFTQHLRAP